MRHGRSIAAAVVMAALAVAGTAGSAGAGGLPWRSPVLAGPTTAGPDATVTLHGYGFTPGKVAEVWLAPAGGSFTGHLVTADSSGQLVLRFSETSAFRWYATQSFNTTAVGTTAVVPLHCTVSAAALFGYVDPSIEPGVQTSVEADDERGDVAGVAFDGINRLSLFRATGGRTTTLETFTYTAPFVPTRSVDAISVSPTEVVASVQVTNKDIGNNVGFVFRPGVRYQLHQSTGWNAVDPTGVAPDGTIVGQVHIETGPNAEKWAVVTWATPSSPFHVVASGLSSVPLPVINAHDTVAFSDEEGMEAVRSSGVVVTLDSPDGTAATGGYQAAVGLDIYGSDRGGDVVVWQPDAPAPTVVLGRLVVSNYSIGSQGAVDATGQLILSTAAHALYSPAQGLVQLHSGVAPSFDTGDVLDGPGTVIFTAPQDLLPHRETCR